MRGSWCCAPRPRPWAGHRPSAPEDVFARRGPPAEVPPNLAQTLLQVAHMVGDTATVLRKTAREIAIRRLVPGDLMQLSAGDMIPADCRVLAGAARAMATQTAPNAFQAGINSVSWLLIRFAAVMVPVVLLVNGFTKGNWLEAFLFSLSVAVGLTPEMHAQGQGRCAKHHCNSSSGGVWARRRDESCVVGCGLR